MFIHNPNFSLFRYFAYIHPLLPVVNKTAFLEEYRGIKATFPAATLLNAIYGASVRYINNCIKFNDWQRLDNGREWEFPHNFSEKLFQNLIIFVKGRYIPRLSTIQAILIAHNHSANVESWTSGWLLNCIVSYLLFFFISKMCLIKLCILL